MAGQNNAMEVRFRANMRDLERTLQRLTRINSRAAQQMADAHKRAAKAAESAWSNNAILSGLQRQIGAMGPQLRAMSATIAGLFAGNEALQAAETWTRFTNSLKVAGVEGNNLKVVQDQLYNSAIANGVAIEPLGTLYSRLSQSAGELGASQSQLLKFSNGVTAALRVQGGDAASASGALLQMSQALAGGVVHAEEFNSINEGARPILEAVARGSEKYGGSVAKLRAAMLDGKLSSKEFFDSFLKGSASLEAQAAKAPLTVAQAMTNLHTAFTKFVGETDATYGVTERIGQAVGTLSQNLGVLAQSIAVVGALYAATFVPALGRASALIVAGSVATVRSTAASIADTAALITRTAAIYNVSRASAAATVASRGLAAALAMMGGPIGIAIMAIGAAIAYLGTSSVNAALETEALSRSIDTVTKKREEAEAAESKAKVATDNMSAAQRSQLERTAKLTNQVSLLATEYGRLAVEAKRAAVEMSAQQWVKANDDFLKAKGAAEAVRPRRARGGNADTMARQEAEWKQSPEYQTAQTAWKNRNWALDAYGKVRGKDALEFSPKPVSAAVDGGKKPGKAKAVPKDRGDDAVAAAEREYRDALAASAQTADERHKYALEALAAERDEKLRQLEKQVGEKSIKDADAAKVKATIEATYQQKVANAEAERKLEVDQRAREQAQAGADLANEAARIEADNLTEAARYERDTRKRHAMERSALAKKQAAEDAAFRLQQDQLALDREKAGWTKEVIGRLRRDAEANREAQKAGERTSLDRDQQHDRPTTIAGQIDDYAKSFGTLNEQLGSIANGAIDNISRGLTDAVMGAKSFKEAFGDMAKAVIAQLIEMAIRFAIFEAIGMAFGVPGLGRASLGMSSSTPIARNAKGTDRFAGGLSMVGENGPELAYLPAGTQIAPNNLLRNALSGGAGRNGGMTNNNYFSTTVNANDSVLTETVKSWIDQSQAQTMVAVERKVGRSQTDAQRNRLIR